MYTLFILLNPWPQVLEQADQSDQSDKEHLSWEGVTKAEELGGYGVAFVGVAWVVVPVGFAESVNIWIFVFIQYN